jgi:hypothetical protein
MTSGQNEYQRQRRWSQRAAFSQAPEVSGSSSSQMQVMRLPESRMRGIGSLLAAMNRQSAWAAAAKVG